MNWILNFKLLFLTIALCLSLGCAKQRHSTGNMEKRELSGTYRVMWSDGTVNEHVFMVEQGADSWIIRDGMSQESMRPMSREEIKEMFGEPAARGSECIRGDDQVAVLIICAADPGLKIDYLGAVLFQSEQREFISKTGYFTYIDGLNTDLYDLEKIK